MSSPVDDNSGDVRSETRQRLIALSTRLGLAAEAVDESMAIERGQFEPLVTVVVPVLNNANFVLAAVDSVRRQSYSNWECVVVDDGSSDGSGSLVEADVAGDRRFRVIRRSENGGPAQARNIAIEVAVGEYLAFLDADDLLLPESLADRVSALQPVLHDPFYAGSYIGVVYGPPKVAIDDVEPRKPVTMRSFVDFVVANSECPFSVISPLVSMARIRRLGGFDESMVSGAADWDLWYRMLRNGYVFRPAPSVGAIYRQHGEGITRTNPARHTAVAAGLIGLAYQRIEPSSLRDPTPFPMIESLQTYQRIIKIAERAVRFGSMALADGGSQAMRDTLSVVEKGYEPLLTRHLDLYSLVADGVARSFGVAASEVTVEADALAPLVSEIRRALVGST